MIFKKFFSQKSFSLIIDKSIYANIVGTCILLSTTTGSTSRDAYRGDFTMQKLYLDDFQVGQIFGSGRLIVNEIQIKKFAAEFDPQPFHLDVDAARHTFFKRLAASGWHTAALTMRLLVEGTFKPAGGIIGAGIDELRWPRPVYPGDELRVETEILELRPSKSRPEQGIIRARTTTLNQNGEIVQVYVGNLIVPRRSTIVEKQ